MGSFSRIQNLDRAREKVLGKLDAESAQKREADAQRTQGCHSGRESLMSSSSRDHEATEKLVASRNWEVAGKLEAGSRNWKPNYHISPAVVSHMDTVCSMVRQIYGRSPTDDLKDFDVNKAIWCIFLKVTLQAAVRLAQDYTENLRFTKNQLLMSVKELFREVDQGSEKFQVWPPSTFNSLRGDRRLYYVTKLLRLRMPKPTTSQTRCYSWEALVLNQFKPGKTRLNVIWAISKIRIESMESRWSSSGKISQDSQHWEFLERFKNFWLNYSANLNSSQRTTTLYGENEET